MKPHTALVAVYQKCVRFHDGQQETQRTQVITWLHRNATTFSISQQVYLFRLQTDQNGLSINGFLEYELKVCSGWLRNAVCYELATSLMNLSRIIYFSSHLSKSERSLKFYLEKVKSTARNASHLYIIKYIIAFHPVHLSHTQLYSHKTSHYKFF